MDYDVGKIYFQDFEPPEASLRAHACSKNPGPSTFQAFDSPGGMPAYASTDCVCMKNQVSKPGAYNAFDFLLALSNARVLALNTAHVLPLNKADVLALNKAHVLRLNTKICPVFTANTKEAAFGRLHKGGGWPSAAPPLWFPLCWL